MKMQKSLLLLFLFFFSIHIKATDISKKKAEAIGKSFINIKFPNSNRTIDHTTPIYYHNKVDIYALNFSNNKGFVLVSADNRAKAIIGYSDIGSFDNYEELSALKYQINEYCKEIEYIRQNNIAANAEILSEWKNNGISNTTKGNSGNINPLLTTIWSQGCYYNDSTPSDAGGSCQHAVTGCVATAMSQVINYYNFPPVGSGKHSYNSNYGTLTANFGNTYYNWNQMADTLSASSSAAEIASVAQLISHAGISVNMMYSAGSSGAYSEDAAKAFTHYFNFDNKLKLYHKSDYTDSIWIQMIKQELDSLHPVYYDGNGTGGHAFVCDGYQNGNYFHFNWGWSGSYNGYFTLSNLNPGGMNFSNYCGAVLGMRPGIPKNNININDTLTEASGNFSDESYSSFYRNNTNHTYLISPDNAASIRIDFYTMDLASGDSIFIYNGNNSSAPLLGSYGGNVLPQSISSSSAQIFVQFVSNGSDTASGWSASYQSEYCLSNNIFTSATGTITDGSANANYNNNTYCSWLIIDSLANNIVLTFDTFSTESGYDFVNIYDGNNNNATLLGSYSGQSLPPSQTATSGNMFIEFISDGGVVDKGWSANYHICKTPPAPFESDSADICQGDSLLLINNSGITNSIWIYNGVPIPNNNDTILYAKQNGNYKYISYQQGCAPSSSPILNLQINNLPNIDLGNDTNICIYNNLVLSVGSFDSYYWNTGDSSSILFIDSNVVQQYGNTFWILVSDSNNCINSDTINITLSPCLSIGNNNKLKRISIFPNPVKNKLWIMNLEGKSLDISVIDNNGKEVISKQTRTSTTIELDVRELSSGTYFLRMQQCTNYRSIKFIKQ